MPYAIAALFDAHSQAGIQALRARLAEVTGANALPEGRPHLTLAVVEELDAEALRPALLAFCQSMPPLPLHLAAVGAFPTAEGIVYLAPVVTQPLLAAHASLCRVLTEAGYTPEPYYRPQNWVPHCTVAVNLAPDQVGAAVSLCLQADVFHADQLTQLMVARYPPQQTIYSLPLRGQIAPSQIAS